MQQMPATDFKVKSWTAKNVLVLEANHQYAYKKILKASTRYSYSKVENSTPSLLLNLLSTWQKLLELKLNSKEITITRKIKNEELSNSAHKFKANSSSIKKCLWVVAPVRIM